MKRLALLATLLVAIVLSALPSHAVQLCNNAWMTTSTTGTGVITLITALNGYQTFDDCGITNGQSVRYRIFDGSAWEVGSGTYTTSGTTLSRSVLESSNADSAINLTGSATVIVTPLKQDLPSESTATDGTVDESAYLFALESGALARYQVSTIESALDLPDLSGTLTAGQLPAATSSAQGAVELATDAEAITGTDTTRAVTPANVAAVVATIQGVPSGVILPYGGTTAPSGWEFAYGQAVSRSTCSGAFTAYSTTYGAGDGSTTFNLPDLRGRVVAGQDDMGGTSANRLTDAVSESLDGDTLGDTGGAETHTLTEAQMPAHTHIVPYNQPGAAGTNISSSNSGGGGGNKTSGSTGSGSAHNNVQPTIILNHIVKC